MTLRLYNTLTRTAKPFTPLAPPTVSLYVCGPTVYDAPHLGHARSAYVFDVLRRYLEFHNYQVRFVRNVTDVDDKIIEKARQELAHSTQHTADSRQETGDSGLQAKCREVAERYLRSYHETMERLGIRAPAEEPHATAHVVPDMTDLIAKLLIQGAAYEAGGDVYFAVRKFHGYGKLSNRSVDELQSSARGEHPAHSEAPGGAGKQDPLDFALWKAAKPGEPSWESPWGRGRPGWHIECSAMSTKYLGDEFDIHGGGVDLVFPHHENELAQARAAGKPFARCWIHNGLLTVNGEKMSKSLGNFVTVEEALTGCREPDVLKMLFLGTHYRSPIDYTGEHLKAAGARLAVWETFLDHADRWRVDAVCGEGPPKEVTDVKREFEDAMDEDLNTPRALAALDKLVNAGFQFEEDLALTPQSTPLEPTPFRPLSDARRLRSHVVQAAATLLQLGRLLGVLSGYQPVRLSAEQQDKLEKREAARKQKDFRAADNLRGEFAAEGLIIEDTAQGPLVRRKR